MTRQNRKRIERNMIQRQHIIRTSLSLTHASIWLQCQLTSSPRFSLSRPYPLFSRVFHLARGEEWSPSSIIPLAYKSPNLPESITHISLPCYSFPTLNTSPQTKLLSSFSMASHNKTVTLVLFISLLFLAPSLQARKLRSEAEVKVPYLEAGLLLSSLPKGSVPPSSPSKGGHETVTAGTSKGNIQRLLGSVPSPGVGH